MICFEKEMGLIKSAVVGKQCFYFFKDAGNLSLEAQEKIKSDLILGMLNVNVEGYFARAGNIFVVFDYLVVAQDGVDKGVNGIFACRWIQTPSAKMLYICTTKVVSEFQNTPLFASMVSYCFDGVKSDAGCFPLYVLYKTVNPIVYRYTRRISQASASIELYPDIPAMQSSEHMLEIAKEGADALCPALQFNVETGVIKDAMKVAGEGYYPEMVRCGSKIINEYFLRMVTLDDQVLGLIYVPPQGETEFLSFVRNISVFKSHEACV